MKVRKVEGNKDVRLLECVNPKKDKWYIRWDVQEKEEGTAEYMECELSHKPSPSEIKTLITDWYNDKVEQRILRGLRWNETPIWLSKENQLNFKAAYDLAVQTNGSTLPVTFKLGTDEEPAYHEFKELDEFTQFYVQMVKHIQESLKLGWKKKDEFDLKHYQ